MPAFTIILSTYDRPQVLHHTIQSIRNQTFDDWILLVIGDSCGPETAKVVAASDDERIFYVNLPERCGEQAGPNSAGIAIARTDFIAFANHDDIWLPNHLQRALACLQQGEHDLYCSRAAFTTYAFHESTGSHSPAFNTVSPLNRQLDQVFARNVVWFEPVSSWVAERSFAQKIGPWNPATTIYRFPLHEWILRAWRAGARAYFDSAITTIYCNADKTKWVKEKDQHRTMYGMADVEGVYWMELIRTKPLKEIYDRIRYDVKNVSRNPGYFAPPFSGTKVAWVFETLLTPENAKLYQAFGWDAYSAGCHMIGKKRGQAIRGMLKRRTGEELNENRNWHDVTTYVERVLNDDERWLHLQ